MISGGSFNEPPAGRSKGLSPASPEVASNDGRTEHEEAPLTQLSREQNERLGALVGRWHTQGWTREEAGTPSERIDATDTYEWLPGRAALLHLVDATVGETKVEGAEIIGFDPDRGHYGTLYYGTDGPTAYEADLTDTDGVLVWEMRSAGSRFRGSFDADGELITGHWELLVAGSEWRPWMDITLRKQAS